MPKPGFVVQLHSMTVQKDASDNVVDHRQRSTSYAQAIDSRYLAEVLQGTQCATEVPNNSGISLYQRKKIGNARRLVRSNSNGDRDPDN